MARKKRSESNNEEEIVLSSQMESGVQYVFHGWDKKGRSLWRVASSTPILTSVGPAEAAHRDFRRSGINVQNKITKPLPGGIKPGGPRKGGWTLGGTGN